MKRFLKERKVPFRSLPVEQFYLVSDVANAERYRRIGTRYIHTRKIGGGLVREEWEEEISRKEYLARKAENRGGIIRKDRLIFEWEGRRYELDRFLGPLKGLNILEIEFSDEEEARSYRLPDLFAPILIDEVTEDGRFTNGALSKTMKIPTLSVKRPSEYPRQTVKNTPNIPSAILHPYQSLGSALAAWLREEIRRLSLEWFAYDSKGKDPEALHQFRIALRKIRILLHYAKQVFVVEELATIRKILADGMRRSTALRDLDVLLFSLHKWKKELDSPMQAEIEKLKTTIDKKRRVKRKEFEQTLESESWQEAFDRLIDLACVLEDSSEAGETPVILSARKRVKSLQKRFLERGKKLRKSSSSKHYHRVRILAKELRYTLEFFTSICDKKSCRSVLKEMKRMQESLGEEHDAVVQSRYLKEWEDRLFDEERAMREMLKNFRHSLEERRQKSRTEFKKTFRNFEEESGPLLHHAFCGFV